MGGAAADASLGLVSGVIVPTCENMWGVLIFLRFFYVVGHGGVGTALLIVFISWLSALFTTLSLAAIATNSKIQRGGAYFLISRTLGHKIGGAVGVTYYMGLALLAVLEVLGAVETLLGVWPSLGFGMPDAASVRLWSLLFLSLLTSLVYFGMKLVSRLGVVFAVVVALTLLSYYIGLIASPLEGAPPEVTGLSTQTFKDNWAPGYDDGVTFSDILSVFFPCFTGILSGANRAQSLKDPQSAIPYGTLIAICLSACLYSSYMCLWGAVADRDYLKHGPSTYHGDDGHRRHLLGGGEESMSIVADIAWPAAKPVQVGIIIASLSQALQCLIVSPSMLSAIAAEGTIPFLARAAKLKNGEPHNALMFTFFFCLATSMIGSLDMVAPLLSICFLTAYASLCFSTFTLSVMRAPSWRPTWKFYHPAIGLIGTLLCITLGFLIRWYFCLVALFLVASLYLYIDVKQVQVDWGSALSGLSLQIAVDSILSLRHEGRHASNWRPQLLCLHKLRHTHTHAREELLGVAAMLKKGQGLVMVAEVMEGDLLELASQVPEEQHVLEKQLERERVRGFVRVLVAPDYRTGKRLLIQGLGIGSLEPNTVLLGWPHNWRAANHSEDADILVETICECTAMQKAMIVCMNLNKFPSSKETVQGFIDVWWIVHDGGLLLLVAHLLQRHRTWVGCALRVHTIVTQADTAVVQERLEHLLREFRIDVAEVHVVHLDSECLAAYTHDWTLRQDEAAHFARELLIAGAGGSSNALAAVLEEEEGSEDGEAANGAGAGENAPAVRRRSSIDPAGGGGGGMRRNSSRPSLAFPAEIGLVEGVRHERSTSRASASDGRASLAELFPSLGGKKEESARVTVQVTDADEVTVSISSSGSNSSSNNNNNKAGETEDAPPVQPPLPPPPQPPKTEPISPPPPPPPEEQQTAGAGGEGEGEGEGEGGGERERERERARGGALPLHRLFRQRTAARLCAGRRC